MKEKKSLFLIILMTSLVILPPIFLGVGIFQNSVNIPYMDDWFTPGGILLKIRQGNTLSFQDFISQHNESRPLFPRFIFIILASFTNWNLRYQMLLSLLIAVVTALNIFFLSKKTVNGNVLQLLFLSFLANLLMFSPLSENWIWGIQAKVFIPIACITSIALIFQSHIQYERQIFFGVCLATISTFSYANGLLAWVVTIPSLLVATFIRFSGKFKTRILGLSLWFAGLSLNLSLYFYNYGKPGHHPSFLDGLNNPLQTIQFFLAFLGASLGEQNIIKSIILGGVLVFIFTLLCFYILIWGRNQNFIKRITPWIVVASYSFFSGLITTLGRVGFGLGAAIPPRYINFSLFLSVALIYMMVIVWQDIKSKQLQFFPYQKFIFRLIASALTTTFLYLSIKGFYYGMETMKYKGEERTYGKSCLLLINYYVDQSCIRSYISNISIVDILAKASQFNQYDLLTPKLVNDQIFTIEDKQDLVTNKIYGNIDNLSQPLLLKPFEDITLTGWAILPEQKRKADAVILTYEGIQENSQPFTIVRVNQERPDVAEEFNQSNYQASGWQYDLSSFQIPAGTKQITAWAFDTEKAKAYKIKSLSLQLSSHKKLSSFKITDIGKIQLLSQQPVGNIDVINGSTKTQQAVAKDSQIIVAGWATLPQQDRIPDKVFITIGNTNNIVAATSINVERPDVAAAFKNSILTQSGWKANFSSSLLKEDSIELKAWVYDQKNKVLYPIPNTFDLQLSKE